MIVHTKMPFEVPNGVIMYHEKRIEWNILISACMHYEFSSLIHDFQFVYVSHPSPSLDHHTIDAFMSIL